MVSVISRVSRSTELRVPDVSFDDEATTFLNQTVHWPQPLRVIANKINDGSDDEYREKAYEVRIDNHLPDREQALFLEVVVPDASEFTSKVRVSFTQVGPYPVLRAEGPAVPNTLAAVLLKLSHMMPLAPHAYFEWSERPPAQNMLRFLLAGEGDVPPLTHEILRRAVPDERQRPQIHVGG